jgi:hypothetical protein
LASGLQVVAISSVNGSAGTEAIVSVVSVTAYSSGARRLPFLAAVALALIERTPFNEFATWRRVASLSTYLPRLPRGPAPTAGPSAGDGVGIIP